MQCENVSGLDVLKMMRCIDQMPHMVHEALRCDQLKDISYHIYHHQTKIAVRNPN